MFGRSFEISDVQKTSITRSAEQMLGFGSLINHAVLDASSALCPLYNETTSGELESGRI